MPLSLAYYPDPILTKKAKRVNHIDDALRQLVNAMVETMHAQRGIGLAAPQVFHSLSLFVSCVPIQVNEKWYRGKNRVFINPSLISCSVETQLSEEGCLSLPELPMKILRPLSVHIQATDLWGQKFEDHLSGLQATNFLHEYDHLQGILIIDYLKEDERKDIETQLEEIKLKFHLANSNDA